MQADVFFRCFVRANGILRELRFKPELDVDSASVDCRLPNRSVSIFSTKSRPVKSNYCTFVFTRGAYTYNFYSISICDSLRDSKIEISRDISV